MDARQTVLITGACGHLGTATAAAFRDAGWRRVLVDRSADNVRRTRSGDDPSEELLVGGVDLADADTACDIVERATARFGRVDALVTAVGAYRTGRAVHEEDLSTWDVLLVANLRTALVACRAALPGMLARGHGRIVTVASRDALTAAAGAAAYAASKAALLRLTETVAAETRGRGVTANCVLPGAMDTPQNRAAAGNEGARLVPAAAVAEVIVFLASRAARAVTGAAIPVEGA
ncbi:MAG TPA: SDR family NAD(P)-dependent oxidoreductase [Candidatus Binatia bacterium]|nr:SDR family NAD(P)-dependent oxidoreductase [Candidatus Binatia bacterium]